MIEPKDPCISHVDGDVFYRIIVDGVIPDGWEDRLASMELISSEVELQNKVSVLQGMIRDQAELNGILETLYRLQVTIISVEKLQ